MFHVQIQSNVTLLIVWPSKTTSHHQHHRPWGQHLAASTSHQFRPLLPQPSPSLSVKQDDAHIVSHLVLYTDTVHISYLLDFNTSLCEAGSHLSKSMTFNISTQEGCLLSPLTTQSSIKASRWWMSPATRNKIKHLTEQCGHNLLQASIVLTISDSELCPSFFSSEFSVDQLNQTTPRTEPSSWRNHSSITYLCQLQKFLTCPEKILLMKNEFTSFITDQRSSSTWLRRSSTKITDLYTIRAKRRVMNCWRPQ